MTALNKNVQMYNIGYLNGWDQVKINNFVTYCSVPYRTALYCTVL